MASTCCTRARPCGRSWSSSDGRGRERQRESGRLARPGQRDVQGVGRSAAGRAARMDDAGEHSGRDPERIGTAAESRIDVRRRAGDVGGLAATLDLGRPAGAARRRRRPDAEGDVRSLAVAGARLESARPRDRASGGRAELRHAVDAGPQAPEGAEAAPRVEPRPRRVPARAPFGVERSAATLLRGDQARGRADQDLARAHRRLDRRRERDAGRSASQARVPGSAAPPDALVHRVPAAGARDRGGLVRDAPHSHAHRDRRSRAHRPRAATRAPRAFPATGIAGRRPGSNGVLATQAERRRHARRPATQPASGKTR